ncbi:MAG: hypothetical protein QM627_08105 [Luteolibacter sp.]
MPTARQAVWVERLLWLFMLSFSLDYLAAESREGGGGAGLDQLLFLFLCTVATLGIMAIGWRALIVRPGAWLILLWASYIGYLLLNSLAQGVPPGRSLRVLLPFLFCLFGLINAHIAGCMGIRPSRIVLPVFVAACINVPWRIIYGLGFQGYSLETVRFEIQSPAANWLASLIPCSLLLRGKLHPSLLLACILIFIGIFLTISRSMLFPVITSCLAASICYGLGVKWRLYSWRDLVRRLMPVFFAGIFMLFVVAFAAVTLPNVMERWVSRLFYDSGSRNISVDVSYLTRKAEADGIWKSLKENPIHFIHGKGIGASYNWDLAYLPEIYMVIPDSESIGADVWFAGHSTWTYALFSGGIIGELFIISFLGGIMVISLRAAKANASDPGPDQWLAFLPFIVIFSFLSLTLTSNPLHERLSGMMLGMMAGLAQAFFVRASWIHTTARPAISPPP